MTAELLLELECSVLCGFKQRDVEFSAHDVTAALCQMSGLTRSAIIALIGPLDDETLG